MVNLVSFFLRRKTSTTAYVAKKRLQTVISKQKITPIFDPNYFPQLKIDLLKVIKKYIHNPQKISINLKNDKKTNSSTLQFKVFFSNDKP